MHRGVEIIEAESVIFADTTVGDARWLESKLASEERRGDNLRDEIHISRDEGQEEREAEENHSGEHHGVYELLLWLVLRMMSCGWSGGSISSYKVWSLRMSSGQSN